MTSPAIAAPRRFGLPVGAPAPGLIPFALLIAATGHAVAALEHRSSPVAAGTFAATAAVQLAMATAYRRRPTAALQRVVATTTTLLVGAWVASRTVGIAIGHAHGPESIEALDATTVAAQILALLGIAATATRARRRRPWLALVVILSSSVAGAFVWQASGPGERHHPVSHSGTSPAHSSADVSSVDHLHDEAQGTPDAPPTHTHSTCHDPGCAPHTHP